jgi:hypothetical protein
LSGLYHRDETRVSRIKDHFASAAQYVSDKIGRGFLGDSSDRSPATVLALDHAKVALAYIMGLDEQEGPLVLTLGGKRLEAPWLGWVQVSS